MVRLQLSTLSVIGIVFVGFFWGCDDRPVKPPTVTGSFTNSIGMEMVSLSTGYYVSTYETRQSEFRQIMNYNPSDFKGPNRPVENLTADEAIEFCVRLTEHEHNNGQLPKGFIYTLPSFKEWLEYVSDASLEGSITRSGQHNPNLDSTMEVGSGEKNSLGIYDLRGNVYEYSRDYYNTGSNLHLGAAWYENREDFLEIGNKAGSMDRNSRSNASGFRCVLVKETSETNHQTGDTLLHELAATGQAMAIRARLGTKDDVNARNRWMDTPLHRASLQGHLDAAKALVVGGADINAKRMFGWTPLHHSIMNGDVKIAKLLIDNGANVNARNGERTQPLHLAAKLGEDSVVKLLIEAGASVNAVDYFKWTALHHAACSGNVTSVKLLIAAGANVNQTGHGWTALMCADKYGHTDVARLLKKQ